MKTLVTLLFSFFALCLSSQDNVLIKWDFETDLGNHTLFPTFISDTSALQVNDVRYSTLIHQPSSGASGQTGDWGSSSVGWFLDSSIHTYNWTWIEFRFFVQNNFVVFVDSISFFHKRNLSGPTRFDFRYHRDQYGSPIDAILLENTDTLWHKWSIPVESFVSEGYEQVTFRIYGDGSFSESQGSFALDSVAIYGQASSGKELNAKVLLSGPYNSGEGLMHDSLRTKGLIPLQDPYGFGESVEPSVLQTTGPDAIVDWVTLALRLPSDSLQNLVEKPLLLQRDGDIVALDGISPPRFPVASGDYYVVVRHRNHLGLMTASPVSDTADFTSGSTLVFGGSLARNSSMGSTLLLWSGDVNQDQVVKYTGGSNDRDEILLEIGGTVPTNSVSGYYDQDVNMDGVVKYTGGVNDRDPILVNIGGVVPTSTKHGFIP